MGQPLRELAGKLALGTVSLGLVAFGCVSFWSSLELQLTEDRRARREISSEDAAAIARRWADMPGVAGTARGVLARVAADASERPNADQWTETRAILAEEPSNSEAWLTYAKAALVEGEPESRVKDIYRQSFLTGRYEGRLFFDRALFAIAAWSIIPEDLRKTAMSQLILGRPLEPRDYQRMRLFLRAIPDETRVALSGELYDASQSEADRAWLRGLGIYPPGVPR